MPTLYHGANGDFYKFDNLDQNYLNQHNTDLVTIFDHNHSNNPIHGTSGIQAGTITNASIAPGTIQSASLAASLSVATIANNTYLKFRNNANNADVNGLKLNTSDKLELDPDIAKLRMQNNVALKLAASGGSDISIYKANTSDQWEYLTTAYSQSILAKTTNTYDIGGTSNVFNKGYFKNLRISDYTSGTDFYEEGSWTPVLVGSSTAGTGTYSSQGGRFVRKGREVTVYFRLDWSGHTGTGNFGITGVPFTASNSPSDMYYIGSLRTVNLTFTPADLHCAIAPNGTSIELTGNVSNAGVTNVAVDTSGTLAGTLTYRIA